MNHFRATRIYLRGPDWGGYIGPRRGTQRSDPRIVPCVTYQSDSRSSQELTGTLLAMDEGHGEMEGATRSRRCSDPGWRR